MEENQEEIQIETESVEYDEMLMEMIEADHEDFEDVPFSG